MYFRFEWAELVKLLATKFKYSLWARHAYSCTDRFYLYEELSSQAEMASDDKIKRFRQHVVQELYDTEKDYTNALDFTVTVSYCC